jgi:hypothetical protein
MRLRLSPQDPSRGARRAGRLSSKGGFNSLRKSPLCFSPCRHVFLKSHIKNVRYDLFSSSQPPAGDITQPGVHPSHCVRSLILPHCNAVFERCVERAKGGLRSMANSKTCQKCVARTGPPLAWSFRQQRPDESDALLCCAPRDVPQVVHLLLVAETGVVMVKRLRQPTPSWWEGLRRRGCAS